MIEWTVKGEAGKAWNEVVRPFGDYAITLDAQIVFKSVGTDTFNFKVEPGVLEETSVPDLGQVIYVYRDGVLYFHGTVIDTRAKFDGSSATVAVVGPWWYMDQVPLTGVSTDATGVTEDRVSFVFGTDRYGQQMQTSIIALMDRLIALGIPMQKGTVATFHEYPRITLNQMSCGQAFSELIRLCPDAMTYFDYSTIPASLHVTRRNTQDGTTITVGEDPIVDAVLSPRLDLQVKKVSLPYLERAKSGKQLYKKQTSSGVAGPGTSDPDKLHVLAISGAELDTYLPNDDLDYVVFGIATSTLEIVQQYQSANRAFRETNGYDAIASIAQSTLSWVSPAGSGGFAYTTYVSPAVGFFFADTTTPVTGGYYMSFGEGRGSEPPDWAKRQLGLREVIATGGAAYLFAPGWTNTSANQVAQFYSGGASQIANDNSLLFAKADAVQDLQLWWYPSALFSELAESFIVDGTPVNTTVTTLVASGDLVYEDQFYVGWEVTWFDDNQLWQKATITAFDAATREVTLSAKFITESRPDDGDTIYFVNPRYYKWADYDFIVPPDGLAEFLRSCQDYVIYEGDITLTEEDVGATRYSGKVMNIANSFSAYAAMKSMVSSETLDIGTGTTTITLGCAERINYRTVVDRIRKTSQDNIYYIT